MRLEKNGASDEGLVRCKDCKHRGVGSNDFPSDIQWPDNSRCPCNIGDQYYSWIPDDDWFCANGERR